MFRLLVVEDQTEFYEDYLLRIFEKLLPMEKISVVHVPTLTAAVVALQEPWDFVLMDYSLGPKIDFFGDAIKDGADLVTFRRAIEKSRDVGKCYILGTSSNNVGNELIHKSGADSYVLKLEVPQMTAIIKQEMKQ